MDMVFGSEKLRIILAEVKKDDFYLSLRIKRIFIVFFFREDYLEL